MASREHHLRSPTLHPELSRSVPRLTGQQLARVGKETSGETLLEFYSELRYTLGRSLGFRREVIPAPGLAGGALEVPMEKGAYSATEEASVRKLLVVLVQPVLAPVRPDNQTSKGPLLPESPSPTRTTRLTPLAFSSGLPV